MGQHDKYELFLIINIFLLEWLWAVPQLHMKTCNSNPYHDSEIQLFFGNTFFKFKKQFRNMVHREVEHQKPGF